MRYALISDIHGNLEALQAVMEDLRTQGVDAVHCLGDVVGYGCNPVECMRLIMEHCEIKLMGNHEYVVLGLLDADYLNDIARESMHWTGGQLTEKEIEQMADFDMDAVVDDAYLVHSSPFEPEKWHYILSIGEARIGFEYFDHRIGFFGHSHVPMVFKMFPDGQCSGRLGHDFEMEEDCRYLVNIGSVGQPRDNDPRASYVVVDSDEHSVRYRRIDYDIDSTQRKMAEARLPEMLSSRLRVGR